MADDVPGRARRPRPLVLLLGVVALLAAAGSVILPDLLAANLCSNEAAAVATLRNLASCQRQFQERASVDADGDGTGEFGTLQELTGTVPLRASPGQAGATLRPPLLSPALAGVTTEGWVEKAHYAFAVFLPRKGGGWIREVGPRPAARSSGDGGCTGSGDAAPGTAGVSAVGTVDADLAERAWVAIAWPRMLNERTKRVLLVTAQGDVFQAPNGRGITCATGLPQGPPDVLPLDWKPGDPLPARFSSRTGEEWKATN